MYATFNTIFWIFPVSGAVPRFIFVSHHLFKRLVYLGTFWIALSWPHKLPHRASYNYTWVCAEKETGRAIKKQKSSTVSSNVVISCHYSNFLLDIMAVSDGEPWWERTTGAAGKAHTYRPRRQHEQTNLASPLHKSRLVACWSWFQVQFRAPYRRKKASQCVPPRSRFNPPCERVTDKRFTYRQQNSM